MCIIFESEMCKFYEIGLIDDSERNMGSLTGSVLRATTSPSDFAHLCLYYHCNNRELGLMVHDFDCICFTTYCGIEKDVEWWEFFAYKKSMNPQTAYQHIFFTKKNDI